MIERTIEGGRPHADEYPHLILLGEMFKKTRWNKIVDQTLADPGKAMDIVRAVANAYHLQMVNRQQGNLRSGSEAFLEGCLRGEGILAMAERMGYNKTREAVTQVEYKAREVASVMQYALPEQRSGKVTLRRPLEHLRIIGGELILQLQYPQDEYHEMARAAVADPHMAARLLAHISDAPQAPPAFVDTPETRELLSYFSDKYTKGHEGTDDFTHQIMLDLLHPDSPLSFKELARVHDVDYPDLRALLRPEFAKLFASQQALEVASVPLQSRELGQAVIDLAGLRAPGEVPPESVHANEPEETPVPEEGAAELDGFGHYLRNTDNEELLDAATEVDLAKKIEAGLYAQYLLESVPETEWPHGASRAELEYICMTGKEANERFALANLRLVTSIAVRYKSLDHMRWSDIVQEGNAGLMRAIRKFDYTRGFKFSTYAAWWIRQGINMAIVNQERTIRIPEDAKATLKWIAKARRDLTIALGRKPDCAEIAAQIGIDPSKVQELMDFDAQEPMSLNQRVGKGDTELIDLIANEPAGDSTEALALRSVMNAKVQELIQMLPDRYRKVIELRYGDNPLTFKAIGDRLGVSRVRACQIEAAALQRLRLMVEGQRYSDYGD